jgi:eight-cysteine-cluster-containing protein
MALLMTVILPVTLTALSACSCAPVVAEDDPLYERFEGTGANNDCFSDDDCLVSGCSGEVCAAQEVATTCEVVTVPDGVCGCFEQSCQWLSCSTEDSE